jgi:6-phosphogluconolactonase (cycloisomerase 2 family)
MSTLKVNSIANNGSAVDLPNGAFNIGGNSILQGYTSSATEPASPSTGDFWWDSTNEDLYQYLNGEFKAIGIVVPTLDLSNFTYDNVSFSIGSQETQPSGLAFKSDGTKLYISGRNSDTVYQYSLSTAFDITTASYDSVSRSVSQVSSFPWTLSFSTDGTKFFIMDEGNDTIYGYTLTTAWDLSTAQTTGIAYRTITEDSVPKGFAFNNDGSKMYVVGWINDSVDQYSLSTAFDISTASYDSKRLNLSATVANPASIRFNANGTKAFIHSWDNDTMYQYSLSTAFDISTGSYDSKSLSFSSLDSATIDFEFNADFSKMYIIGQAGDAVYQYSTNL